MIHQYRGKMIFLPVTLNMNRNMNNAYYYLKPIQKIYYILFTSIRIDLENGINSIKWVKAE